VSTPLPRRTLVRTVLVTTLVAALAAVAATALLVNIIERKAEAKQTVFKVAELSDDTDDPEVWGRNYPLQYDGYRRTVDQTRTRFGGSEALPHTPSQADPRSVVSQSKLQEDPRLVTMWAGYAFSKDFREERGHAYMLVDQLYTERQVVVKQPGTCINCHASTYVAMKKLGQGDLQKGFDVLNAMPYSEAKTHLKHPVTCLDCHDSQTMALRVTRPAFMRGIAAVKKLEGVADYQVNRDATRQELRSYVCGQCHVEYYFQGSGKALTFPWDKGLKADDILELQGLDAP
jgi:nitrite reductase (cytochrome c-552)